MILKVGTTQTETLHLIPNTKNKKVEQTELLLLKDKKQINQQPSADNVNLPILSLVSGNSTKRTTTLV